MMAIATMPKKVSRRGILSTFLRITASGSDNAVTAIMKASTVPIAMPFYIKAWTMGMMPAALEYSGTPIKTASGTANGLSRPAYFNRKSAGA